jgi:HK97 family phage portal protein
VQILTREGKYETRGASGILPWGNSVPPTNGQAGGGSAAGIQVTDHTALQLAAVWGSVAVITDSISELPIRQWQQTSRNESVEIDAASVIEQPWSEFTRRDFMTQGTVSLLLRGNLWGRIVGRDARTGCPDQVQLVNPHNVKVRRSPQSGVIEYRYWNQEIPADQVTRAMGLSVPEGIVGLNPIENMRNALGVARAQDLYSGAFFANSARPDGWIGVEDDLDDEETKAMLLSWQAAHQGANHAHLPAILTGGAKWNAVTMSMQDAQFLEQMQYSASVISGMIYRVPPHMLGMVDKTTSWGQGIEQQELGFVRNTLGIWLARWEDLFRSWLPAGQFVTFDLSQRLRGDALQRWSGYQIARILVAMNNSEVRAAEGLPKVTDPAAKHVLEAYDAPINSSPVKPLSNAGAGPGGDHAM